MGTEMPRRDVASTIMMQLRHTNISSDIDPTYHSKCLNLCYEPTEESGGSLLRPILGA